MDNSKKSIMSHCRKCGGNRHHSVYAEKVVLWEEEVDKGIFIDGVNAYLIAECDGCKTVTFVHRHWFSEDTEHTVDGSRPVIHYDLYPPAPTRKKPEWNLGFFWGMPVNQFWIIQLHEDIYKAIALKSHSLAAMGIRTIVDWIVTKEAGDFGTFKQKLIRMSEKTLISETQIEVILAAFDAGSAAAHRGYSPELASINTLLDIAENLLEQIYIIPMKRALEAKKAKELNVRTPKRPHSNNAS
jgi:hypothetical protein